MAAMAMRKTRTQPVPGGLGAIRLPAIDGAYEWESRFVQPPLPLGFVSVLSAGLPKPALGDFFEQLRQARVFGSGLLCKLIFEPRRETPTVDLRLLHALQRSARVLLCQTAAGPVRIAVSSRASRSTSGRRRRL
jgi:hypothetical protein